MSAGETDVARRLVELGGTWIVDTNDARVTKPNKQIPRNLRHFTIVGTSGSHDYLKDSTSNQRFWSVYTPTTTPADADDTNTEADPPCDGNHDTGASLLYPCTRCFPYGPDSQRNLDEREDSTIWQDEDQDYQEPP